MTFLFTASACAVGWLYLELRRVREASACRDDMVGKYVSAAVGLLKSDMDRRMDMLDDRHVALAEAVSAHSKDMSALSDRVSAVEEGSPARAGKALAVLALAASIKDSLARGRDFSSAVDAL
ncbi:MAG: hypothetical protein LBH41_00255, partial [Rickettsiales bacterium]|nr:hypothetical protein [Rickettsiales bacterium]